ncbi:hypothetical protein [Streptomyces sp. 5-10]|uniref:hypothetical protein n=1 Tax=Streptomyces sp. 5-10 TaxID=878925 RepID=UPI00168BF2D6|nr:hypothetical protein [Streptomyces sp. 5-10]MBD3004812.1 hypothetical protein [Streptomyces sp. 5-10]
MTHPMLEEGFSFTSYNLDGAVKEAAKIAGLPDVYRGYPLYTEGGPDAYQMGYDTSRGQETFVFDLAGMSLEGTADRFLLWSGAEADRDRLVYIAPSFTRSFMDDLRKRRGKNPVHFLRIPENSTGFEVFDEAMAAPDQPEDDSGLEQALAAQRRPEKPRTLEEAREMVENYVAKALERDMSPPEASIEAMRVCAWLECFAKEDGYAKVTGEGRGKNDRHN